MMSITDKENYARGLLQLLHNSSHVSEELKQQIKMLFEKLELQESYYNQVMQELEAGGPLIEKPGIFTNTEIAKCFIKDCIRIASLDKSLNIFELQWLVMACTVNNLSVDIANETLKLFDNASTLLLHMDDDWEVDRMFLKERV